MLELKQNKQPEFAIVYVPYAHTPGIKQRHPHMPKRVSVRDSAAHAIIPKKFTSSQEAEDYIKQAWGNRAERDMCQPEVVSFQKALKLTSRWYDYWTRVNMSTGEIDESKESYSDYLKHMAATKGVEEEWLCDDYDGEIPISKPEESH